MEGRRGWVRIPCLESLGAARLHSLARTSPNWDTKTGSVWEVGSPPACVWVRAWAARCVRVYGMRAGDAYMRACMTANRHPPLQARLHAPLRWRVEGCGGVCLSKELTTSARAAGSLRVRMFWVGGHALVLSAQSEEAGQARVRACVCAGACVQGLDSWAATAHRWAPGS